MIVLDSSALVEVLLGHTYADQLLVLLESEPDWIVPEHFVLEVASALRGLWLGGHLDLDAFTTAVTRLEATPLDVWPSKPLLGRVVELTANATAYDAAYVALAERLEVPLVTVDVKLTRIPGVRCRFLP